MVGEYDVVVLGTGAAGLTATVRAAAEGAHVGLFERAGEVGGTSAWSGGVAWLPNNRHEVEAGFVDSIEDVLTYLMSLSHGLIERPTPWAMRSTLSTWNALPMSTTRPGCFWTSSERGPPFVPSVPHITRIA